MEVPILMYHRIAAKNRQSTVSGHYVHPKAFARQMAFIRARGFQPVALSTLYEKPLPTKPIVITFDDGYENFHQNALPILEGHGFPSTVFLVANLIGKHNVWDADKGDVVEPLMNRETILDASHRGTEFGSHTLDHADLASVTEDEAWHQIADSKARLEDMLALPIRTFCYPYGRKSTAVMQMVKKAGYALACSTEKGMNTLDTNRFALRRINVRSDTSLPIFIYKLLRGRNG